MPALTIVAVDNTTDTIQITAHGQNTGDGPGTIYTATGVLPGGLTALTDLYFIRVDADHVKVAASSANALAGTAINITSNGSGTLLMLVGIPYRRARTYVALAQVKSLDLDAFQDSLTALWNLLTGQAQAVFAVAALALATALESTPTALLAFRDWKGQNRTTIDHLGYRGGQVTEYEEHWKIAGTGAQSGWTYTVATAGTATSNDPTATFRQRFLTLLAGAGVTNAITCNTEYLGFMDNDSEIVFECTVQTGAISSTSDDFRIGLQFAGNGGNDFAFFNYANGTANWQAMVLVNNSFAGGGKIDSGVAVAANTLYRFRVECLGSNNTSQAAGTFQYKFYINGTLVATRNQSTLVTNKWRPYLRATNLLGTTMDPFNVGRIRTCFNHVLSSDSI